MSSHISLIPWDADSVVHRKSLTRQRVECSWDQEKVEEVWREQQLKGEKCIYWIVTPFHVSQQYEQMKGQLDVPKSNEVLYDTATSMNGATRHASQEIFNPIGHISLDSKNPEADGIGLDLPLHSVFWIKTFFISHSFQSQGFGRAAMDEVEHVAAQEPLFAKTLMLDTVQQDDQKREDFAKATYGSVPKLREQHFEHLDKMTYCLQDSTEEWYTRRGFKSIKTVQNYYRKADKNGKIWDTKAVFMRKDIS